MTYELDEIVAKLSSIQSKLVKVANFPFRRFLWGKLNHSGRLVGIKGPRGAGKTTLLLQWIMEQSSEETVLYASLDHPLFYSTTLYQLAEYWSMQGGTMLFLDEVHKYPHQLPGWSSELKAIYDSMPELSIVFTASSALELITAEADLSRRATMNHLPGMSFREYLMLYEGVRIEPVSLDSLVLEHNHIAGKLAGDFKPLVYFHKYLKTGYLPFSSNLDEEIYHQNLLQALAATLEVDLMSIEPTTTSGIIKMKQLLGIISESVPFKPNISKIAEQIGTSRDTVYAYLQNLERAQVINQLHSSTKGIAALQKPEKIYLENTNLCYALRSKPDRGNIRETFAINQLKNAGYHPLSSPVGDLVADNGLVLEIGGKGKGRRQLKGATGGIVLADDIEMGFGNRMPLWMLGLLY
jgi:predicted AAA+ superfamily ATPase